MADKNRISASFKSYKAANSSLGLRQRMGVIWVLSGVLINVIAALFTFFRRSKTLRPEKYSRYVFLTVGRTFMRLASVQQQQYVLPHTDEVYLSHAKKKGYEPKTIYLTDGTAAHWIGNDDPDFVLVNFHGGGYVLPAAPAQFDFLDDLTKGLNRGLLLHQTNNPLTISTLFLSYSLAPSNPYPTQLKQATLLLDHIINTLRIPPSRIVIMGDSAGSSLALASLSHITHPHPSTVIPRLDLPKREYFKAVVLLSPWVNLSLEHDSWVRNRYKDIFAMETAKKWAEAWMGASYGSGAEPFKDSRDFYNFASLAPKEWWAELPVTDVLVVCGLEEGLVDGIRAFSKVLKKGFLGVDDRNAESNAGSKDERVSKFEYFQAEGEFHDMMNIGPQVGEKGECQQALLLRQWLLNRVLGLRG